MIHHANLPEISALHALAESLLPPATGIAFTDLRMEPPPLMAGEELPASRVVPARSREYAAGRAAARSAMAALDLPPRSIPQGADRAPVWPRGIVGSISHTSALCVAAVSQTQAAIGVDLEPDHPLEAALIPSVCTQREIARLPHNRGRVAKLIFCAKEAAYKAQYALSASLMDFKDFDISFAEAGQFQARFSRRVGPFAKGSLLHGRHGTASGHLVTAVAIAQAD